MGHFTELVRDATTDIFRGYMVGPRRMEIASGIPLNLVQSLPEDLLAQGVERALTGLYGENAAQEAQKTLQVYPAEKLLYGDALLDRLDLLGTPTRGKKRFHAVTAILDLDDRMGGLGRTHRGLISIMAGGWTLPARYAEFAPAFDMMAEKFDAQSEEYRNFRVWGSGYILRDGILDVSAEMMRNYGEPFDAEKHAGDFVMKVPCHGRLALPGVSTMDYLGALVDTTIEAGGNLSFFYVPKDAENWRVALTKTKAGTLEAARHHRSSMTTLVL